jgi:hypothetical protein
VNPHITPTGWLLLGLIILCALCLFAVFIGHCIDTEWNDADQPIYRTVDSGVLSADARAALRKASNFNAPVCTGDCNQGRCCTCSPQAVAPNLQTTHREGTAAALGDMGRKPGTPPTPNPHSAGTLAHFAWRSAYERASTVCNGGALS